MRCYLSGPMTDLPESNFPAFHAAAARWREKGWEVLNPAESFNGDASLPYKQYVAHDLEVLATAHAIAMLPGWDGPNARGSVWEREIARKLLGIPVLDAEYPFPPSEIEGGLTIIKPLPSVLEEAQQLVHGDRQTDYGHPAEDFGRTAGMATALFSHKLKEGTSFSRQDVAAFMILVKLSRLANRFKRDSVVDIAGYAATAAMCDAWEKERSGT